VPTHSSPPGRLPLADDEIRTTGAQGSEEASDLSRGLEVVRIEEDQDVRSLGLSQGVDPTLARATVPGAGLRDDSGPRVLRDGSRIIGRTVVDDDHLGKILPSGCPYPIEQPGERRGLVPRRDQVGVSHVTAGVRT
jgi:hypothetical protein